ncbi:hypothetical protein T439DRAFT_325190 [Meredithblackwellia eburnea MCA 4105]
MPSTSGPSRLAFIDAPPSTIAVVNALNAYVASPSLSVAGYLGFHVFLSVAGTLTPDFDFSATQGPGQLVLAAKTASVPSPDDPAKDVAWLQLTGKSGNLAKTKLGAFLKCTTEGEALSVNYAALYYFMS